MNIDGMTDEQKRCAIAEAVGWTQIQMSLNAGASGKNFWTIGSCLHGVIPGDAEKHEDDQSFMPIPDYIHSLDCMAEAEKTLTDSQYEHFYCHLIVNTGGIKMRGIAGCRATHSSTAAQRADAFLLSLP